MKNPICFVLLSLAIGLQSLCAQDSYWLKIQPKAGTEYRFINNVSISVVSGGEALMSTSMEQNVVSKILATSPEEVSMTEKIEKIKGSSTSMGRTFDFDTSNPMAGNPTMNAQMEQLVGKELVSRFKPNGLYVSGNNPFEGIAGGSSNASDFRNITGGVRYAEQAIKIGESWTVVDTIQNQGMTTISYTTWTLQEIKDDWAILSSAGTGNIAGQPPMMPDGKVEGTMTAKGSATIELQSGICRESSQRIEAKMNMSFEGQTQQLTSVTETAVKRVN
ncbi:MAG: DUF6263 family protein [Haliscomenobacter sp.]|uniref:DUF6263 family protein n=1 Tax=Haliscomenobacter sp. TaxID=2717303 RepID=UPI0029B81107|nr:DUF6263 family protein [Haliscomenobacter sp.]MDX2070488.1 DUF6263 family protein [Haliscomenobacter sp.]